jgi:3-deoxy-D-manno-octulosonate 8-phosphate phosphatase (KDO 8-P phosphatase)
MAVRRLSAAALAGRLRDIRLLSLDVDGVLTDGGLYYADDGSQLRKFNVKDGMGMQMARKAGVEVAIITASDTPSITHRGHKLGLVEVHVGVEDKLAALTDIAARLGIPLSRVAHVGDDVNDIPVLEAVGLPMTVADAVPEVLRRVRHVTRRNGGQGAVREICDAIVAARG